MRKTKMRLIISYGIILNEWSDMVIKKTNIFSNIILLIVNVTILVYTIISIRNLIALGLNIRLIMEHSSLIGLVINTSLYALVVIFGIISVYKYRNLDYTLIALLTIIFVY